MTAAAAPAGIVAVLVLYKVALADSPSYRSLMDALACEPDFRDRLHLMVCDNSPVACSLPADFTGTYHHQPGNPGLAESYNRALHAAETADAAWLILLDQDTTLTPEYLRRTGQLTQQFRDDAGVVALVPRLVQHGQVHSPHGGLRRGETAALPDGFSGLFPGRLHAFNSGAVLRMSALRAIGGFPADFWLDFLDHATFHLLQQQGRMYVMDVQLEHELSTNAAVKGWNRAYLQRHWNLLQAEDRYYRRYGSADERRRHRIRLLRHGYGSLKHARLPMVVQILRILARWA